MKQNRKLDLHISNKNRRIQLRFFDQQGFPSFNLTFVPYNKWLWNSKVEKLLVQEINDMLPGIKTKYIDEKLSLKDRTFYKNVYDLMVEIRDTKIKLFQS